MTEPMPIIDGSDVTGHPTSNPDILAMRAIAAIEDYCGWHVAPVREETIEVESDGSGVVFLPTLRIESISAVTVDGSTVTVKREDWSRNGWLRVSARCGVVVAVTLKHGFEVTESLKAAALGLAAMEQQSPDGRLISAQRLGDRQVSYYTPTQLTDVMTPGDPRLTLNRYVIPPRP